MASIAQFKPRPYTYRLDNIIVDDYAEKIGAIGVAILNVLARHADRTTGICYPSIGLICKKLRLGRTTVKKYLRILLNHDLIAIAPRYTEAGDLTSNSYMLLDPSPDKIAQRRRQRDLLLSGQLASSPAAGPQSPGGPPPSPSATDPRSPGGHEQSVLNKERRTSEIVQPIPQKQRTCAHPAKDIAHLSDDVHICNHCYGLLDAHGGLLHSVPAAETTRAA